MGWKLGGGSLIGGLLGGIPGALIGGGALQNINGGSHSGPGQVVDTSAQQLQALADQEEAKRNALGLKQQQQILDFANQQQQSAGDYRTKLAQSLSDQGQQTFQMANPAILEDLNARGLFTSQTARDQSQAQALKEIALANQGTLTNYDTNTQNQINDLKSSGLSAMVGGEQSAVDTALGLRQQGIQNSFNFSQQQSQNTLAQWLAQQQSRNQLTSSIIGLGGQLGAGMLGGAR